MEIFIFPRAEYCSQIMSEDIHFAVHHCEQVMAWAFIVSFFSPRYRTKWNTVIFNSNSSFCSFRQMNTLYIPLPIFDKDKCFQLFFALMSIV
jgi:hypothetical protein